jgi:hypothetical protein
VKDELTIARVEETAALHGVPFVVIGRVIPERIVVDQEDWGDTATFADTYDHAIERSLRR